MTRMAVRKLAHVAEDTTPAGPGSRIDLSHDFPPQIARIHPFLDSLARVLLGGIADASAIRFPPAGIVCLASQEGRWTVAWAMVPESR